MTPEVSDFIPGSLEDTDKYIEVADGHHVMAKQKGQVQIQMCDNNGKTFINVMIENNLSHKSGAKSTLCNVAIEDLPLSSHICICT